MWSRREDMLKIDLYGDISIKFNNIDITQKLSKKSIGMMAYLLNMPNYQASKDSLRDLLWIDAGEKAAYNLRFNLWNIKKIIPEIGGESFILTSGNVCKINPNYPWEKSDIDKIAETGDEEIENLLVKIAKEGTGTIFMEHFYLKDCDEFNDWVVLERSNKERQILRSLEGVKNHYKQIGEYSKAIIVLERMSSISPFEDDILIEEMELYSSLQKHSKAISVYKKYIGWLKKEMGIGPSKRLKETYQKIIQEGMDADDSVYIKDKEYSGDYSAAIDLLKTLIPEFESGISVNIMNWQGVDEKSKEFFEALSNNKMIILGGK